MLGIDGEVWTITTDEDDNIYAGTREKVSMGGVYKCLANQNQFNKMKGIDKCVSSLKFEGTTLFAKVWTGVDWNQITSNETYECLVGEEEFKIINV